MGNLMTSFNAGVSGLHSAQQSLTVTSHNLANAGTVGYTRQQVLVTDSFYQKSYGVHDNVMAVGTGTTISLTRQVRNTFWMISTGCRLDASSFIRRTAMRHWK